MVTIGNHQLRLNAATVVAVSAGVGASLLAAYVLGQYRKAYAISPYTEAGRVNRLFVYPLKSCKGVETSYIDCTTRGPRNGWLTDREFILIDEAHGNQLISARAYPEMVLVECDVAANSLTVRFPRNGRTVVVNLDEVRQCNNVKQAILFENLRTDGYDCGDELANAWDEFLGVKGKRKLRVLRFSPTLFTERDIQPKIGSWHNPLPKLQDHIAYADATSYMINTEASIDDLNDKLTSDGIAPIEMRNFRPSISVSETLAYDEDRWLDVRIGDAEFVCFLACSRCMMTTIDPNSGKKDKLMQPLRKLREYRLAPEGTMRKVYGQGPLFGVNLSLKRAGRVRVGDTVFVRYKPTPF